MHKYLLIILFLFSAFAYSGTRVRTIVEPANPNTSDIVSIGVDPFITPCLTFLTNNDGLTELVEFDGNDITVTVVALAFTPCPGMGSGVYFPFEVGTLAEGDYTIRMFWAGPSVSLPVSDENLREPVGEIITFQVVGAPVPVNVPSLTLLSIIMLGAILMTLTRLSMRKTKEMLVLP